MDDRKKDKLAIIFAREMFKARNVIDGLAIVYGGGPMTVEELCAVGRRAIGLIEQGFVK